MWNGAFLSNHLHYLRGKKSAYQTQFLIIKWTQTFAQSSDSLILPHFWRELNLWCKVAVQILKAALLAAVKFFLSSPALVGAESRRPAWPSSWLWGAPCWSSSTSPGCLTWRPGQQRKSLLGLGSDAWSQYCSSGTFYSFRLLRLICCEHLSLDTHTAFQWGQLDRPTEAKNTTNGWQGCERCQLVSNAPSSLRPPPVSIELMP